MSPVVASLIDAIVAADDWTLAEQTDGEIVMWRAKALEWNLVIATEPRSQSVMATATKSSLVVNIPVGLAQLALDRAQRHSRLKHRGVIVSSSDLRQIIGLIKQRCPKCGRLSNEIHADSCGGIGPLIKNLEKCL